MRPASTLAAPPTYQPHRPERTVLYSIISEHYPHFVQEIELSGGHLPQFVRQEFEEYLKCGLLEHGFLRGKCDGCRHEHLVAFSCKRRGFCPSCGARRMVESVAHLVDHVFPEAPVREWALTFPFPLRFLLAALVPMSWAQRLGRVFAIDIERCLECGGNVRVIACIEDPHLIAIILAHVRGQEAATTKGVARAPPVRDGARLRLN